MQETIKGKDGQKPISFEKGGLHATTSTPADQKIPSSKIAAKGKQQALFMKNVLKS